MNIKFGDVIPKGYYAVISSWENDGDHNSDIVYAGLDEKDIEYLLILLPQFNSKNSRTKKGVGNSDVDPEQLANVIFEADPDGVYKDQLYKFFEVKYELLKACCDEDEYDDLFIEADIYDKLTDLIGFPVDYEYGFVRVFESMVVYYLDEQLVIPTPKKVVG